MPSLYTGSTWITSTNDLINTPITTSSYGTYTSYTNFDFASLYPNMMKSLDIKPKIIEPDDDSQFEFGFEDD